MEEIDLKEFLQYLRKYIWIMLAAAVVLVGATAIYDCGVKQSFIRVRLRSY